MAITSIITINEVGAAADLCRGEDGFTFMLLVYRPSENGGQKSAEQMALGMSNLGVMKKLHILKRNRKWLKMRWWSS